MPPRRPRILFLADRNILANQAFNSFSAFPEDALVRIAPDDQVMEGEVQVGRLYEEPDFNRSIVIREREAHRVKLTPLLRLKYRDSIADAVADLGDPQTIGDAFAGFQKYLYLDVA